MNTLTIDIGGTGIKAAILPAHPTLQDLSSTNIQTLSSEDWMGPSLARIIDPASPGSFSFNRDYDRISLAGPFIIDTDGCTLLDDEYYISDWGVPEDLCHQIGKISGRPVSIVNDSDAWARGIQRASEWYGITLSYPFILTILGTGVALSIHHTSGEYSTEDLFPHGLKEFPLLRQYTGHGLHSHCDISELLGRTFFQSTRDTDPNPEFRARVRYYLQDLQNSFNPTRGISQIWLAGGNSYRLHSSDIEQNIRLLHEGFTLDTQYIPLIGLL